MHSQQETYDDTIIKLILTSTTAVESQLSDPHWSAVSPKRCSVDEAILLEKIKIIGMQKQRAKCWHNRSKFEQNVID